MSEPETDDSKIQNLLQSVRFPVRKGPRQGRYLLGTPQSFSGLEVLH